MKSSERINEFCVGVFEKGRPNGYIDNELRGYKLLKSAVLDVGERQSIPAPTRNSMEHVAVAAALRGV